MIDIVIPNNNEKEFIAVAEKLRFTGLCFLYSLNDYLIKQENFDIENKKVKIYMGILANKSNIFKIKDILEKQNFSGRRKSKAFSSELKHTKVFVAFKSSNNDREIIEKSKTDIIFSLEDSNKRDFIHQRASGLNHILCKLAKENNVIIGFSLNSILNSENKHEILGRIKQNIKICRKFKVRTIFTSFAEKPLEMRGVHDITSLSGILGLGEFIFLKDEDIK